MQQFIAILAQNSLFAGVEQEKLTQLLSCLSAVAQSYQQGQQLILEGYDIRGVGIVVAGSVQVVKTDAQGKTLLLTEIGSGGLFGEVFACAGVEQSPVSVVAATDCTVTWIDYKKIITTCSGACSFHNALIANMLRILAQKNLMLNEKISILSKRTIRERLWLFLQERAGQAKTVTLPFNREEMAAYLCVDRSALSAELSKMQQEGLIAFHKNRFTLL